MARSLPLVVCGGYQHERLGPAGDSPPIPWTTLPAPDGWCMTPPGDKFFDLTGEPVWLCPKCASRYKKERFDA